MLASPAIVSPATTDIVSGKKSGIATIIAVKETKKPFWLTRSRKGGPSPGGIVELERSTAVASAIGINAIVASIAQVRRRRKRIEISENVREPVTRFLSNLEALPRQLDEALFKCWRAKRKGLDSYASFYQQFREFFSLH